MAATKMTPAEASSSSTVYLRTQAPAWTILQAGLSAVAVFIIARHCVRWLSSQWCCMRDQRAQRRHLRWTVMDEKSRHMASLGRTTNDQEAVVPGGRQPSSGVALAGGGDWKCGGSDSVPRPFVSRLPPAPHLTPPELSPAIFSIEDALHRQDSFIHQPNPDYMASTSPFAQTGSEHPSRPRRRSYTRTIPIGIPAPRQASCEADSADLLFSPSSYPPASPLLPPPPPPGACRPDGGRGPTRRGVDVKGEIISALDGGGPCLACAASGGQHGGGFYGATVALEEMR